MAAPKWDIKDTERDILRARFTLWLDTILARASAKCRAQMNDKFSENIPISYIAQQCYISESRLYHLFQNELQVTPTAYRNERRIFHSTELLTSTNNSIEQIAFNVGFQSVTHFREVFRRFTGLSPAKYRSNFMQNKINVIKSNNN